MLKTCPVSVDVSNLQFKLQCQLKIYENEDISSFSNTNSLLTCASRYGLLFVGTNSNHFEVIQTQILQNYSPKEKDIVEYPRRDIQIPSVAKHLCVNCDSTILAVVVERDLCPIVIFYEVISFLHQNVKVIKELRLSATPNVYVREINWNPSLPAIFTACKSDGSLGVYELKTDLVDINELPVAAGVTCFCWSPKGKQIAVGSKDGRITQYKPDLKAVKAISEPKFEGPHSIINLQWVSNYQFIGVYQSAKDSAVYIIVVDAPKSGEPSYTNYEDICYSGSSRPPQFYLILQQTWNFLMVASANSTEVGVLSNNGEVWTQWIMPDTARAELPLSSDHQETFPVGLTFDISSTTPLPWGESSIPPCPLLCILSHQGVLCCFNVVYLKEGISSVCTPPDPVGDTSGLNSFVTSKANKRNVLGIVQPKPQHAVPKPQQDGQSHNKLDQGGLLQSAGTPSKTSVYSFPTSSVALNIANQSTPLMTGKDTTDLASRTLFGGQATLTPIKPPQSNQNVPLFGAQALITPKPPQSNQNVPLFGAQALITPINKDPNSTTSTNTSTGQAANVGGIYASTFSSLNPTPTSQSTTLPVKPIVISALLKPEVKPQETIVAKPSESVLSKSQEIAPKTQVASSKAVQKYTLMLKEGDHLADPRVETGALLSQMIRDEWMFLEAELKVLINIGRTVKVGMGTDQEKVDMIEQIASLEEFVKDAVDISVGQSSEIHCLKQNLIQSWAWFEEAKSHYNSSKNEAIALLIKLQPLDSLSEKRLKDIEQLIYYIDSQLSQASKTLDEQWDNFQDYAKKTYKVKMPTMEAIFQTMVRQSAILQKQTYVLKDISVRLRRKPSNVSSLLISLDKGCDLTDDFRNLRLDPQNILQLQYEKIKSHTKNVSDIKAKKLRSLLNQSKVTRVTAVKPQISSWTITQSPASRMRQSISKLGASVSPVAKASIARNLDFVQTPQPKVPEAVVPVSLKTVEKPMFGVTSNAVSSPSTLVPLVKSGPVISSPGSAFTRFGGSAMSFATSDSQQQVFKSIVTPMSSFSFAAQAPNKTISSMSQITPTNPSQSLNVTSITSVVTTVPSSVTFSMGDNSKSVFKSTSYPATIKPQLTPSLNNFAINTSNAAPKSVFDTGNIGFSSSSSNTSFPVPTAAATTIANATNQLNKSGILASIADSTGQMIVQPQVMLSDQGPHKAALIEVPKESVIETSRSTSGVASIFANLQSVIDKATNSTAVVPSIDNAKSPIPFSASTTTTQSVYGSLSSTTMTKPLFGSVTASDAGSFFGSMTKSADDRPVSSSIQSVFEPSTNSSVSAPIGANIFGRPVKVAESFGSNSSSSIIVESSQGSASLKTPSDVIETKEGPSTPSNVISVSLFGSKSADNGSIKNSSAPAVASTTTSIFGNPTGPSLLHTGPNIFGGSPVSSTTSQETVTSVPHSVFESSKTTGLPTSTLMPYASSTVTAMPSVFGSPMQPGSILASSAPSITSSITSTTTANIFATGAIGTTTATSTGSSSSSSIFGGGVVSASGAPNFGTPSTSIFGSPATSKSIFGPTTTTSTVAFGIPTSTIVTSAFGAPVSSANIFGSPTSSNAFTTPTTTTNIFVTPSTGSIFGGATPAATTGNIFASPATSNTTAFGTTTTTSSPKMFGSTAPASTTSSIFGGTTTSTAQAFGSQSGSIFGASNTAGNVFGQSANFGNPPAFGTPPATTASSIFGQPTSFDSSSQSTVFGPTTTTANASGNIFAGAVSSNSGFGSGFGPTPTTNTFGTPTATHASSGSFGFGSLTVDSMTSPGSMFGSSSGDAFGQTPAVNPFGKVDTKSSFGSSGSSIFGNTTATSASTNAFGSPVSTASSMFGSNTGSTFGSTTSGGGFGTPGAFGATSFGQKSAFGQPAGFGSTSFGSPQTGAFSGGSTSPLAQSGFGSPSSFQKPSGFGSAPVFAGSPAAAFGASPSFGGAASFGSAPTFGSPEKVFGSNQAASGGFPSGTQQSAGFGNLASQSTIGFGNLAQQANTPTSMPFSGNSSFSSWR